MSNSKIVKHEPRNENIAQLRVNAESAAVQWKIARQKEIERVSAALRKRDSILQGFDRSTQIWLVETPSGRELWRGTANDVAAKFVDTFTDRDCVPNVTRMCLNIDEITWASG